MKRYKDYYGLPWLERFDKFIYEGGKKVKLYVAESIKDITKSVNSMEHSSNGLMEIVFPENIKLSLEDIRPEFDDINFYTNILGFPILDYQCTYLYSSAEFSECPFQEFIRLGIKRSLLKNLHEKRDSSGLITLENCLFSHFAGQKYPELIDYDIDTGAKKRKIKNPRKRFQIIPLFAYNQ